MKTILGPCGFALPENPLEIFPWLPPALAVLLLTQSSNILQPDQRPGSPLPLSHEAEEQNVDREIPASCHLLVLPDSPELAVVSDRSPLAQSYYLLVQSEHRLRYVVTAVLFPFSFSDPGTRAISGSFCSER